MYFLAECGDGICQTVESCELNNMQSNVVVILCNDIAGSECSMDCCSFQMVHLTLVIIVLVIVLFLTCTVIIIILVSMHINICM